MKKGIKAVLSGLIISIVVGVISGCVPQAQAFNGLKLSGPWDLDYLAVKINNYTAESGIPPVRMYPSSNSIAELKKGEYDGVLLGREPTADELHGLKDYIIAYDAVCIIIDENSYVGGKYGLTLRDITRKTDGLRELSGQDLEEIFSFNTGSTWPWNGEYYIRDPNLDRGSWLYQTDMLWIKKPAPVLCSFIFPPGKFDTQSVLFRSLGLDEQAIAAKFKTYPIDPKLKLEEEVLSYSFDSSVYVSRKDGPQDFTFKLGFASRRVMLIAPQHVPVRTVSIDGIDPMEDVQSIYDSTYKLSRRIHFLVPDNSSSPVKKLVDFLTSPEGQQIIADAGYLTTTPLAASK